MEMALSFRRNIKIELVEIQEGIGESLTLNAALRELTEKIIKSYEVSNRIEPWWGYLCVADNEIMGCCGFKSNPTGENRVEIAYETFLPFRNRGIATAMCLALIEIAQKHSDQITLYARTIPSNFFSEKVLAKCGFSNTGLIEDHDGAEVNEWILGNS